MWRQGGNLGFDIARCHRIDGDALLGSHHQFFGGIVGTNDLQN
jgi:hypothetical protein